MKAPPLLVSFSSAEDFLEALPDATRVAFADEIKSLTERGLPAAVSSRAVGTLFGVSGDLIGAIRKAPHRYYRTFSIRKGKKVRQIQSPRVALKIIQRWIGYHLAINAKLPKCVFGFVPGRSVIQAASSHCNAKWVYSVDLRDFFPSIQDWRVVRALKELGYSTETARLLSEFCTLDGKLPQGSPASPVLSNLVFMDVDVALEELASLHRANYSRYADDLVFSGADVPPEGFDSAVKEILAAGRWEIAPEKEHLARLPHRLKVHGLLVHGDSPRLTKGYRKRIRAYRHLLSTGKVTRDAARIRGHLAYANSVESSKT